MRLERIHSKKRELYDLYLNTIKDIKFTYREIDIIVCVLHNRGEKKIASILSISPRTVGTHMHNIMLKLGYNSRDSLIDFIEKSGKLLFARQYYLELLTQNLFEEKLIKIGKTISKNPITSSISYAQISIEERKILNQIQEDLKLAHVDLKDSEETAQQINSDFYLTDSIDNQEPIKATILILNKGDGFLERKNTKYLDFSKKEEYCFVMFDLLRKIINKSFLEDIIKEFKKEYDAIDNSSTDQKQVDADIISLPLLTKHITKRNLFILSSLILLIVGIITLRFFIQNSGAKQQKLTTDMPLINNSILLKRQFMLKKIEKKLAGDDDIKSIALVGIGGSGKTTLARQYTRGQKSSLTWEISCETNENILASLQNLAYALCDTEEDRQALALIFQNPTTKDKNLLVFLKKKISSHPNWILVYDNVENFKDIQQYFPHNRDLWGNGKVIITTRNANIANSHYILAENVLEIDELELEEKLDLFKKIMGNDNYDHLYEKQMTLVEFLTELPPFPLDISIAAHYIKEMKVSYNKYLEYINQPEVEFAHTQNPLRSDVGEYNNTRYEIITFSIQQIVENNPDFADLLLFISLINSDDIPKELLVKYKDETVVNKFLHELKRFSLIHDKPLNNKWFSYALSMHRTTQSTALTYLTKKLQLTENNAQLQEIANCLLQYLITDPDKPNKDMLSIITPNIEKFLTHSNLLKQDAINNLSEELGIYYSKTANYLKAKILLKNALTINKKQYGSADIKTARVAAYLAILYKNTGDCAEGIKLMEEAIGVYQSFYGKNNIKSINCLTFLGNLYRDIGNYKKSIETLEYALQLHKKTHGLNDIYAARTIGYLGNVYNDIGAYSKARVLLEDSFNIYNTEYGNTNFLAAGSFTRLANLYKNINENSKAKDLAEQALAMYRKNFGDNHLDTALALLSLGDSLIKLGMHENALKPLEQALSICQANFGDNHLDTALVLNSLGTAYFSADDLITSESLLNKALTIFQEKKHPNRFISLEKLSDLYIKKSIQAKDKSDIQEMQNFKKQATIYLKQALEIAQTYLPENSSHITRIQSKFIDL
jgi:tetratricopeptide (TPR) repeat protein/DNA-binding CsgD family transcriptional regulator